MKKPEPPKPRIIREDFLPEQDPMENYRIKKVTKPDGKIQYYPQKKFLWFWRNIGIGITEWYDDEYWAHARVFQDYNNSQKDKVEYLVPDNSKIVTNPPPQSPYDI